MAKATTRARRLRPRGRRRAQPYFLLWVVVAFAAFVGAHQLAFLQRDMVAGPTSSPEGHELLVETTRLDGSHDAPLLDPAEPIKELASSGRFSTSPIDPGELRWVDSAPLPFVADPVLTTQVMQRINGRSGRYGIAIKDLRTGRGVLVDPDGRYEAASLFKLSVMYEVFKQREAGSLSFSEPLILTQRHVDYDLGTLDRPVGASIGLGEAVERMVTISDNSSAILLTDRVGAGNISGDVARLGMTRTHLSNDDLSTSPGDMLTLFEAIARGNAVSREASADMLYLLARQRVNDRLPRLLPPGATVAHKTGNLPGVVNDAGIVYAGDQVFVIAVLVEGTQQEGEAARITSELAAVALDYFSSLAQRSDVAVQPLGDPVAQPAPWPTTRPAPTPLPIPTATPTVEVQETRLPTATASATPGATRPVADPESTLEDEPAATRTPVASVSATILPATPTEGAPLPASGRGVPGPERRVPGGGAALTPTSAASELQAEPTTGSASGRTASIQATRTPR